MTGLREVIEQKGLFCALYSDRGSHFFVTRKAGEKVDPHRLTQVGRAMKELGVQMIPAYSPQARGRCERSFGTWQNRLPQELRLAGIGTLEQANAFLRDCYIAEFNRKFAHPASGKGTAFRKCGRKDLGVLCADRTCGGPGQHRGPPEPLSATQQNSLPKHLGRLYGYSL